MVYQLLFHFSRFSSVKINVYARATEPLFCLVVTVFSEMGCSSDDFSDTHIVWLSNSLKGHKTQTKGTLKGHSKIQF